MECSAKEQKGINEVFEFAINAAVKAEDESYVTKTTTPGAKKVKKPKKSRCKLL